MATNNPYATQAGGYNDPPTHVFRAAPKTKAGGDGAATAQLVTDAGDAANGLESAIGVVDTAVLVRDLDALLTTCREKAAASTNAMAVRMMEDAGKKVPQLYAKIEAKEEVVLAVLQDVRGVVEALSADDHANASKLLAKLMTSTYSHDSAGNQWILGLKRLQDIIKLG